MNAAFSATRGGLVGGGARPLATDGGSKAEPSSRKHAIWDLHSRDNSDFHMMVDGMD